MLIGFVRKSTEFHRKGLLERCPRISKRIRRNLQKEIVAKLDDEYNSPLVKEAKLFSIFFSPTVRGTQLSNL